MATVNDYEGAQYQAWIRLYNLTFIVGVAWSFALFSILNIVAPVQGLYKDTPFIDGSLTSISKDVEVLEIEAVKSNIERGASV